MKGRACSDYSITRWYVRATEGPDLEWLSRAEVTKVFHGEVEGMSIGEYLIVTVGTRNLIHAGFERFTGTVGDRTGSFIGRASAGHAVSWADLSIVEGTATDELFGLTGDAQFASKPNGENIFVLNYEIL